MNNDDTNLMLTLGTAAAMLSVALFYTFVLPYIIPIPFIASFICTIITCLIVGCIAIYIKDAFQSSGGD